jgi:hypothetical protein
MPDWDADSATLQRNLQAALRDVRDAAIRRDRPTLELARRWHALTLRGLKVPAVEMVGGFRGEKGLERCQVRIGRHLGVESRKVAAQLSLFETELQRKVVALDRAIGRDAALTGAQLGDVIALCAWAHAEWVRIHPFANGNGRTARLWANFLARRYGLPFFVRLRPRPGGGYESASEAAMKGDWKRTEAAFRVMLADFLAGR